MCPKRSEALEIGTRSCRENDAATLTLLLLQALLLLEQQKVLVRYHFEGMGALKCLLIHAENAEEFYKSVENCKI